MIIKMLKTFVIPKGITKYAILVMFYKFKIKLQLICKLNLNQIIFRRNLVEKEVLNINCNHNKIAIINKSNLEY